MIPEVQPVLGANFYRASPGLRMHSAILFLPILYVQCRHCVKMNGHIVTHFLKYEILAGPLL